jgi:hypothetical protein
MARLVHCIVALLPNTDDAGALCFALAIGWVVANWCEASSWSMHRIVRFLPTN